MDWERAAGPQLVERASSALKERLYTYLTRRLAYLPLPAVAAQYFAVPHPTSLVAIAAAVRPTADKYPGPGWPSVALYQRLAFGLRLAGLRLGLPPFAVP